MLSFNCYVCGQPAGKNELGYLLIIHPGHQAGTPAWCKWYRKQREEGKRQTAVGDALLEFHEGLIVERPSVNKGLLAMREANRLKNSTRKAVRT